MSGAIVLLFDEHCRDGYEQSWASYGRVFAVRSGFDAVAD